MYYATIQKEVQALVFKLKGKIMGNQRTALRRFIHRASRRRVHVAEKPIKSKNTLKKRKKRTEK